MSRSRTSSDFDLSLMPKESIVKRTLHSYSVHYSNTAVAHSTMSNGRCISPHGTAVPMTSEGTSNSGGCWIATIGRPEYSGRSPVPTLKYSQYACATEREAKKLCQAYAPPKMVTGTTCRICSTRPLQKHCRNCGVPICDRCSIKWGSKMVPKTYLTSLPLTVSEGHSHPSGGTATVSSVRVCKSCDWLSNAFCLALLQGRYQDALTLHATGNVNLRTSFADIHREAMFPIHCAVVGGSLDLVRWLVEKQVCPILTFASPSRDPRRPAAKRMMSVRTSEDRTLLDLAMTGRAKVDILKYLIQKGLSIDDVKDSALAPKTLEAVMKADAAGGAVADALVHREGNRANEVEYMIREINVIEPEGSIASSTLDDPCKLCCEKVMDCVLVPCGHQMCCADCGMQLSQCPICKVQCTVLRIYRQ